MRWPSLVLFAVAVILGFRTRLRKKEQMTQVTVSETVAHDAALSAQTKATDTHVRAQASIAVAEIGAAGKILDTHVGGKYDVEAAKHALKKGESSNP